VKVGLVGVGVGFDLFPAWAWKRGREWCATARSARRSGSSAGLLRGKHRRDPATRSLGPTARDPTPDGHASTTYPLVTGTWRGNVGATGAFEVVGAFDLKVVRAFDLKVVGEFDLKAPRPPLACYAGGA
jgi:hypothetical protein